MSRHQIPTQDLCFETTAALASASQAGAGSKRLALVLRINDEGLTVEFQVVFRSQADVAKGQKGQTQVYPSIQEAIHRYNEIDETR